MAAPPVKSQPLHNFSFPNLKWARKNPSSSTTAPSNSHHHPFRRRDSPDHEPKPPSPDRNDPVSEDENAEAKPWNLRPRKAAIKTASSTKKETGNGGGGDVAENNNDNKTNGVIKSQRIRGLIEGGHQNGGVEKNGKKKIWISLSKEEIEEDIYAMTGGKPARRPRKWPRNVQKQLDNVFPGMYLVGVSADSYRVTNL